MSQGPYLVFFIFTLGNGGPLPGVPQFVKKIQDKASVQPRLGHQLMLERGREGGSVDRRLG